MMREMWGPNDEEMKNASHFIFSTQFIVNFNFNLSKLSALFLSFLISVSHGSGGDESETGL